MSPLGAIKCTILYFSPQAFVGGGYRLGAAPEEESAYVAGERRASNSTQDVSVLMAVH